MKRKRTIKILIMLGVLGLLVGVIAVVEVRTINSGFDSTVMWNDEEAILVMACSERHARWTIPSTIKVWIQWHLYAGTDAIPITVRRYNIIYHVKGGRINRYRIDDPGNAHELSPYKGKFYHTIGRWPGEPKRAWRWEGPKCDPLPSEEAERLFDQLHIGYDEHRQQEGWQLDRKFNPYGFGGPEKEKVIRLKDCVLHIRIITDLRPLPKPHKGFKPIAEHLFIWLEGAEDTTREETFITEDRPE